MIILRNKITPESFLDQTILRTLVTAKAKTSLITIPIVGSSELVGRIEIENISFSNRGYAQAVVKIERVNYIGSVPREEPLLIEFWLESVNSHYGDRVHVYWKLSRSQLSKTIQCDRLPRLPILTLT